MFRAAIYARVSTACNEDDGIHQTQEERCRHGRARGDDQQAANNGAFWRLDELRRGWLNPPDVSDAELRKRTLTNLYNAHPTWLANAHATLDRAVWLAYGWPKPHEETDETILKRLLALNVKRIGAHDSSNNIESRAH